MKLETIYISVVRFIFHADAPYSRLPYRPYGPSAIDSINAFIVCSIRMLCNHGWLNRITIPSCHRSYGASPSHKYTIYHALCGLTSKIILLVDRFIFYQNREFIHFSFFIHKYVLCTIQHIEISLHFLFPFWHLYIILYYTFYFLLYVWCVLFAFGSSNK